MTEYSSQVNKALSNVLIQLYMAFSEAPSANYEGGFTNQLMGLESSVLRAQCSEWRADQSLIKAQLKLNQGLIKFH